MTTSEPTHPHSSSTSNRRFLLSCAAALVAVGLVWLVLTLAGQPDTAMGALVGGSAVVLLGLVVRWRATRRPASETGSAGRALLGTADERDNAILTSSLAWVGVAAFLANAIGLVALALGADGQTVIGAIEFTLIVVLVTSFAALSRRL